MSARRTAINLILAGLLTVAFTLLPASALKPSEPVPGQPGKLYRSAYALSLQAEQLSRREELEPALEKYREAERVLRTLQASHPGWQTDGVAHKLDEYRRRIEAIEKTRDAEKALESPLKVHFLDVGHGDCALIQCPDGANILIDGGSPDRLFFINDYLRKAGVKKIDLMIATHPHSDHIGSLPKLIRNFPVETILDSGKTHTSRTYQNFLEAIKASPGIKYKLGRAGDKYNFGEVELRLLHPSSTLPQSINNCSIVCRLTYGRQSFLFAGDAEKQAEDETLGRGYSLKSDVLKVGHHGSKTSTSPFFLSAVSPRVAVISRGNQPSPDILRRLEDRGIKVYHTGRDGTIVFLSDGRECRVELPGAAPAPPDQKQW